MFSKDLFVRVDAVVIDV